MCDRKKLEPKKLLARLTLLSGILGPGVLSALADNDAGGVISYAVTGAKFGIGLFIPLTLCLALITYTVQEMSMRLGEIGRAHV